MGNLISSHAGPVNPMSGASTIIGFISFAFTLGTFFRVFWEELTTIGNAGPEVHDLLGNLKQSLYEERTHLRTVRRRCRAEYDAAAFRLLSESVRHLIQEFKELEAPFLSDAARDLHEEQRYQQQQPLRSGPSTPYYSGNPPSYFHHHQQQQQRNSSSKRNSHHSNTKRHSHPPDYNTDAEQHDYDVFSDYFVTGGYYSKMTLGLRLKWLRRRSKVMDLSQRLANLQTRRIARQVTDLAITLKYVSGVLGGPEIARGFARRVEEDAAAAATVGMDAADDILDYPDQNAADKQQYSRGNGGGNHVDGGTRPRGRDRNRRDVDTRG